MSLVDSHCHLNFPHFAGRVADILQNAREQAVDALLCISTNWEDQRDVLDLANAHDHLWASVGKHPTHEGGHEPTIDELVRATEHPRVVAIGETGLDRYRGTGDFAWQDARFARHIAAARETSLPLIIHTRAAADATLDMLQAHDAGSAGGVMHCFAEDWEIARRALDLGFYISFSGIVTFRNAKAVQEAARRVPLDRLLVETDAPYLAPVPHRGKTNEPAFVRHTAARVAELRDIPFASLAEATTANFYRLFSRASPAGECTVRQSADDQPARSRQ